MKKLGIVLLAVLMMFVCTAFAETEALPDPALITGNAGMVQGSEDYAGTIYTAFVYAAPVDKDAFIDAYAAKAASAGYSVMTGAEGDVEALYMQAENTTAAMLLFENDGTMKLMIPQDVVFETVEETAEEKKPSNLYVFICNQLNPSRIRNGAGSGNEMVGSGNYGDMFPYTGTVTGEDGDPWYGVEYKGNAAYTPAGTLGNMSWNYRRACVLELYRYPVTLDVDQDAMILCRPDDVSTGDYNPMLYKAVSGDRFKCFGKTVDEFYSRQWYLIEYEGQYAFVSSYEAEID